MTRSRLSAGVVAAALALALVAAAVLGGFVASPFSPQGDPNESSDGSGSRFAGVVGVHGSEVRGELAEGSLATRLAAAENDSARADVVAAEAATVDERLTALELRRDALDDDDARTRLASIATTALALERQVDRLDAAAATLPPETLAAAGVGEGTLAALGERANALADGDALSAARDVAGPDAGEGYDDDGDDGDDDENDGDGNEDDAETDDAEGDDADDGDDGDDEGDDTDGEDVD